MSGTMIEISEDSDVGTEGERWFLISPGLCPQPGYSVQNIIVDMKYILCRLAKIYALTPDFPGNPEYRVQLADPFLTRF